MSRPALAAGLGLAVLASSGVAGVAHAELGSTTTINGAVPPGVMAKLTDLTVVLDTVGPDGNRLLVQEGIRKPGTRAPIHVHDFAGRTCVLAGTLTVFAEGSPPASHPTGSCYDVPARVPTSAANLGTDDVRLSTTVVAPPEAPTIIVLEPGWPDLTDPTG